MALAHEGRAPHRLSPLVPYAFAGELATEGFVDGASHDGGPARDFNVIVRRGGERAQVTALELAPSSRVSVEEGALVYVVRGAITSSEVEAGAGDALAAVGSGARLTAAAEGVTAILTVSLRPEAIDPATLA